MSRRTIRPPEQPVCRRAHRPPHFFPMTPASAIASTSPRSIPSMAEIFSAASRRQSIMDYLAQFLNCVPGQRESAVGRPIKLRSASRLPAFFCIPQSV